MKHVSYLVLLLLLGACESAPPQPSTTPTAFEEPPQWASEVVWYQIFVERFRNGDPENDPRPGDMTGAYPGFVPDNWQVTSWTQDWYADDPYFPALDGTSDSNGYPLHNVAQKSQLRRYGGDLQGVLDKIDYLDSLGITAIYFNPLNDAPSLHKYDARHWRHIDRSFGPNPQADAQTIASEDPDDPSTWVFTKADEQFLEVLEALHARGIRVILDYSWNHTGQDFWAWQDLIKNQADSKYADWYWVQSFDDPSTPENEFAYRGWAGASSLPEIKETQETDHSKGMDAFEGNIYSEAAKSHIFEVTRRWLDPNNDGDPSDGVDGFRLDVAAEVPVGFWRDYRTLVRSINPDAYLIGELWWKKWPDQLLDPVHFLKGDVFDATMNYRWYKAARQFFAASPSPISVSAFVDSLNRYRANLREPNNYAMMNLTASHDSPRVLTSLFNNNPYKNNASPAADSSYKIHRPDAATFQTLRLLLAQQFTYIGAPHIWAGDEMGMWGADDPSCRKPLIWPDYSFESERAHPLKMDRPVDEVRFDTALFNYYRQLIQIREQHPVLAHGAIEFMLMQDESGLLAYRRFSDKEEIIVVFNTSLEEQFIPIQGIGEKELKDLLKNSTLKWVDGLLQCRLPARSAAILAATE